MSVKGIKLRNKKPQGTIQLSARQREKLKNQVDNCLFFRANDLNSANVLREGIVRFVSNFTKGYAHRHIPLSESINLQLINMGGLFEKAIDLVIDHSIDASIYAFREAPLNYRECLIYYARSIDEGAIDEDPVLEMSYSRYDLERIRRDIAYLIESKLSNLSVSCLEYTGLEKIGEAPRFSLLGTFSPRRNEIEIFPLSTLISATSKTKLKVSNPRMSDEDIQNRLLMARSDIIIETTLESFIHELAHLAFPCTTEKSIRNHVLTRETRRLANEKGVSFIEAKKIVSQYVSLGFERWPNVLSQMKNPRNLISYNQSSS